MWYRLRYLLGILLVAACAQTPVPSPSLSITSELTPPREPIVTVVKSEHPHLLVVDFFTGELHYYKRVGEQLVPVVGYKAITPRPESLHLMAIVGEVVDIDDRPGHFEIDWKVSGFEAIIHVAHPRSEQLQSYGSVILKAPEMAALLRHLGDLNEAVKRGILVVFHRFPSSA